MTRKFTKQTLSYISSLSYIFRTVLRMALSPHSFCRKHKVTYKDQTKIKKQDWPASYSARRQPLYCAVSLALASSRRRLSCAAAALGAAGGHAHRGGAHSPAASRSTDRWCG